MVVKLLDRLFNKLPSLIKRKVIPIVRIRYQYKEKMALSSKRWCNICGWRGKYFDSSYDENLRIETESVCPNCKSAPRQRALFKYLRQEFLLDYLYKIKDGNFLCLEISPDRSNPVEKALPGVAYVSVDLDESYAMYQMDLCNLDFKDNTFDLVVCSHVLEHVEDDLAAIVQIYRVLKNGGIALIQVPIGYYDDPLGERTVEFGEKRFCGHIRSYGWDITDKLLEVGFDVIPALFDDDKLGIGEEVIFKCKKHGISTG